MLENFLFLFTRMEFMIFTFETLFNCEKVN